MRTTITTTIPIGCEECSYTGYSGRTVAYEILQIDDDIRNAIQQGKDAKDIKPIAIKNGMITFEDTYSMLIETNTTTIEECMMNKRNINLGGIS